MLGKVPLGLRDITVGVRQVVVAETTHLQQRYEASDSFELGALES